MAVQILAASHTVRRFLLCCYGEFQCILVDSETNYTSLNKYDITEFVCPTQKYFRSVFCSAPDLYGIRSNKHVLFSAQPLTCTLYGLTSTPGSGMCLKGVSEMTSSKMPLFICGLFNDAVIILIV
jgi:hypothetical protein